MIYVLLLAMPEKGAKNESFSNVPVIDVIDEWFELEAHDETVVFELESMMIVDELLSEVVSFM